MVVLIDGYNLLFRHGYATPRSPTAVFQAARTQLLDWLAATSPLAIGGARYRVVFDARYGKFASGPSNHKGVTVEFAFRDSADDRIAEYVLAERLPHTLTVVSDDNLVREQARRAGVKAQTISEFCEWVERFEERRRTPEQKSAPEKPTGPLDEGEAEELLRAFGG